MEINSKVLDDQIMRKIEQDIICAQGPLGDWIDSVTTTSAIIVTLSEYASTPGALFVIRKGIDWILKQQGPKGAWGHYRYRTKEEEATGEMNFDPDWPHTVYALWAQIQLGFFSDSVQKGIEWIYERYTSEKDRRSFATDLDLLTIIEMIKSSSHPEYRNILQQVSFARWEDIERTILARETFLTSELKSLYRYTKYICSKQSVDILHREALASHIEQACRPLAEPSSAHAGILNFQTTALRILLFLRPKDYLFKAERAAIKLLDLERFNIVDLINIYDTIGQIAMQKRLEEGNHQSNRVIKSEVKEDNATKNKILFLAADPTDASRLRLGEELREIQEELQKAELREHFELHQRMSVRPADISQALLDVQPQIVHFSGHSTSSGALCFENQVGDTHPIQPDALAALFEQFANQVKCVVLNACYSEVQANAIAEHIGYVIGMNQAVGDKAAIAFAIGFYQALGAGRTIEDAYRLGCVQIRLQDIPEYLTPVLVKRG
jgi:hypothetical protein